MAADTRNLRLLSQAVQQVNTAMEIPAIMRCLVASAMELTGATGGAAGLMVEGRMVFTEYNRQGQITPIQYEFTPGYGVPGWVLETRKPYTSNDAANDPHVVPEIQKVLGFQTLADVPIISRGGNLLGCVEIHNKAGGPFDENDVNLLMVLAAAAGGAIENAQLLLESAAAVEALHKSVAEVSESRNMLRLVMDTIPVRVFWKDTQSRYLGCNVHFAHDAGRGSSEDLIGQTDYDMGWREQADLYRIDDQQVITTGQAKVNYVEPQTAPDGRIIWLQTSKIPLRDTQGKIIGLFGAYEDITTRKATEEALWETKEWFRVIASSTPDHILVQDRELRYLFVINPQLGLMQEDMIGNTDHDLLAKEDADKLTRIKRQVLETGQSVHLETSLASRKGKQAFFDGHYVPQFSASGQIDGLIGYFRNVTERKRMEEALRHSEQRLRAIFDHAALGIVEVDSHDRFIAANNRAYQLLGYRPEELLGMTVHEITFPEDRPRSDQLNAQLHEGRLDMFDCEKRYLKRDGSPLWIHLTVSAIRDSARRFVRGIATIEDISERKRAEEALRESEARFRTLFQEEMDGIMLADMETRQLGMPNPQICRMLGYSAEEIQGLKVSNIHPAADLPRIMEGFAKQSRGEIDMTPELPVLRKDGSVFYADVIAKPVEVGGRRWLLGIFRDVTQRKRWEDQLKELNATLEQRVAERTAEAEHRAAQLQRLAAQLTHVEQQERQQLATVLHDHLQQLLVGAKFHLSVLRNQPLRERYLQSLRQADELIDASLKTSRSLTAELSPPILYEGNLAQVLQWLARSAKDKYGLTVTVLADEGADLLVPEMRILIFQAVRELLLNIAKHARVDRASITLTRIGPDQVQILVADEGVGFHRTEKTAEAAGSESGAGFGLFSIRQRLELMGGSVEIDSQPGQGARITLTASCPLLTGGMPTEAPGGQAAMGGYAPGQAIPRKPQDQNVIRVLLADDHEVVRTGLARLLQTEPDIEVVGQAADGQEAMDIALQIQPDVILMDVSMPHMSGEEATRRIMQQMPSIKIIGLSMHEREDVAASMKAAGAAIYLTKTSPPETLIAAIRECTARATAVE